MSPSPGRGGRSVAVLLGAVLAAALLGSCASGPAEPSPPVLSASSGDASSGDASPGAAPRLPSPPIVDAAQPSSSTGGAPAPGSPPRAEGAPNAAGKAPPTAAPTAAAPGISAPASPSKGQPGIGAMVPPAEQQPSVTAADVMGGPEKAAPSLPPAPSVATAAPAAKPAPANATTPATATLAPVSGARAAPLAPSFAARAAAELERQGLAASGLLLLRRRPGAERAAAVLAFPGATRAERPGQEGLAALALLLASGASPFAPAAPVKGSSGAGDAGLRLVDLGGGNLGLLLEASRSSLPILLEELVAALSEPRFLRSDFPQPAFESALRELRLGERRRAQSPVAPFGSALGSEEGLRTASLAAAREYWQGSFPRSGLRVAALGDLEAATLVQALEPGLARFGSVRGPAAPGGLASVASVPLQPKARPSVSWWTGPSGLCLSLAAPPSGASDFPSFLVGLELLRLYLAEEYQRRGLDPSTFALAGPSLDRHEATFLFPVAGPAQRAAGEAALSRLGSVDLSPERFATLRSLALVRAYRDKGSVEIALELAADLAAGNDGLAFYRLEERFTALDSERFIRDLPKLFPFDARAFP